MWEWWLPYTGGWIVQWWLGDTYQELWLLEGGALQSQGSGSFLQVMVYKVHTTYRLD